MDHFLLVVLDSPPSELTIAEKERLSLIAYYGYQINPTITNYRITQNLVWLEFGDELPIDNISNLQNDRDGILNQDKNNILSKYVINSIRISFQQTSALIRMGYYKI
ncbi:hypothetical protein [Listeria seeligeri]|nr:hypothetical protein [Listeria seeligeri]MBM5595667.1 hypothetical protein [Listeria seeligeri]